MCCPSEALNPFRTKIAFNTKSAIHGNDGAETKVLSLQCKHEKTKQIDRHRTKLEASLHATEHEKSDNVAETPRKEWSREKNEPTDIEKKEEGIRKWILKYVDEHSQLWLLVLSAKAIQECKSTLSKNMCWCQIILWANHSIITACCRNYSFTIEDQKSQQILMIKNHSWDKRLKNNKDKWSNVFLCLLQRSLKNFAHTFRRHVFFNKKWAFAEFYEWLLKTMFEKTRKYFQLQKRVSLSRIRSWQQDIEFFLMQHA